MLIIKNRSKNYSFKLLTAIFVSLLLNACDVMENNNRLEFLLYYGANQLNCDTPFNQNEHRWHLTQLQFYIHAIELQNNQGQWHAVSPSITAGDQQTVALVGGVCGAEQQWQVKLKEMIELNDQQAVRFTLGVPFHLNHKNPLTQPSPLNQPDMFWTWQNGHKFLRLEMATDDKNWLFHLGSTGCQSPAPVRPPESACKNPNRRQITLALPQKTSPQQTANSKSINKDSVNRLSDSSDTIPIKLDLKALLGDIDLTKDTSCQSNPATKSCPVLLSKLGIITETGNAEKNTYEAIKSERSNNVQTVFTIIE